MVPELIVPLADEPPVNQNARWRGGDTDPVLPFGKNAPTVNCLLAAAFQE